MASFNIYKREAYLLGWFGTSSTTNALYSVQNSQIQQTVGWVGLIRVDGTTYQWFGNSSYTYESAGPFKCNVTSTQITPTRTVQFVQAGPLNMTLTFLSPIEVR